MARLQPPAREPDKAGSRIPMSMAARPGGGEGLGAPNPKGRRAQGVSPEPPRNPDPIQPDAIHRIAGHLRGQTIKAQLSFRVNGGLAPAALRAAPGMAQAER